MSVTTYHTLTVVVGRQRGEERALSEGEELTVGAADDSGLRLDDRGVKEQHARFSSADEALQLTLVDGGSAKVNGLKADATKLLRNGDRITVGEAVLRVGKRRHFYRESSASNPPQPASTPPQPAASEEQQQQQQQQSTAAQVLAPPETGPGQASADARPSPSITWAPPPPKPVEESHAEQSLDVAPSALDADERSAAVIAAEHAGMWWPWEQLPPLELQHVWFDLERDTSWRSLALVPIGDGLPVLAVAHAFARMASMDPRSSVLVVDTTPGTSTAERDVSARAVAAAVMRYPGAAYDFLDATALGMNDADVAHIYVPQLLQYISTEAANHKKVIIALGPLLENAQSIPIARRVDSVLLGFELGQARLPDLDRTAEIIGRDRLHGALALDRRR